MIHYALRCRHDHRFDGWFQNSGAFDDQAVRGLIDCPVCGDTGVSRALMAPSVARRAHRDAPMEVPAGPAAAPDHVPPVQHAPDQPMPNGAAPVAAARMPDHVRAVLQRLRSEVERNCDYVGPRFADEARRIHRGEADPRGIYGETTPEQAESLADEGIDISSIPWVPRADG